MKFRFFLVFSFACTFLQAQYQFEHQTEIKCTSVKNQQNTGTCWSFSTVSFLESELIRMGKGQHDLSEMYAVRTIYQDKARNYVLRQGKANFSQGSLSHDVIRAVAMSGAVPESVYSGKLEGEKRHDHSDLEKAMAGMLKEITKSKKPSAKWESAISSIMDAYIGKPSTTFDYQGKSYTPSSFATAMGIVPDDYITFTSYTHHPFNKEFILEIPDNYSNGSYHNIPFKQLSTIVDNALSNGYTVTWDGDVSEKGFSARQGIAILPTDAKRKGLFDTPGEEVKVTQALRQETFMNYQTTDDHLMHIVGSAKDQAGNKYYIIKNSWGEISDFKGYLYMSEAYFNLKTVGIMVHKGAVPKDIAKANGL